MYKLKSGVDPGQDHWEAGGTVGLELGTVSLRQELRPSKAWKGCNWGQWMRKSRCFLCSRVFSWLREGTLWTEGDSKSGFGVTAWRVLGRELWPWEGWGLCVR